VIFTQTLNTRYLDEGLRSKTFTLKSIARDLPGKLEDIKNLYGNQPMKELVS
jgi:hypothetical protein